MNRKPTRTLIITVEVYDHTDEAEQTNATPEPPTPSVTLADWEETPPVAPEATPEPRGIVAQARRRQTRDQPTYAEGRAQHPAGVDRAPHPDYGAGRKVHRCGRCGSPHRRYVSKRGTCGLGHLCIPTEGEEE